MSHPSSEESPGMGVIRVLSILGELEWAHIDVGYDKFSKRRTPPFIVWRYVDPVQGIDNSITKGVASYRGTVDWDVKSNRRGNWLIQPTRVAMDFLPRLGVGYGELPIEISKVDPDFCESAISDFKLLLMHLEDVWRGDLA
ncbi:hypothetical protein [Nocardia lasii]|uniref:Uncharacterized protein n=1 Tax=Nocardia lasii TaxID=1616107 RepID=A0ABW1JML9_9NOCA